VSISKLVSDSKYSREMKDVGEFEIGMLGVELEEKSLYLEKLYLEKKRESELGTV